MLHTGEKIIQRMLTSHHNNGDQKMIEQHF